MLVLDLTGEWIPAFSGMTNVSEIMTFYEFIKLSIFLFTCFSNYYSRFWKVKSEDAALCDCAFQRYCTIE